MGRSILSVRGGRLLGGAAWLAWQRFHEQVVRADVLVVGAGISGLSAAYEAGYGGARVAVADMNSVFGGNAVMSEGGLFIVDTPLQRQLGLNHTVAPPEPDIRAWGRNA